jgi:hypothetical protein
MIAGDFKFLRMKKQIKYSLAIRRKKREFVDFEEDNSVNPRWIKEKSKPISCGKISYPSKESAIRGIGYITSPIIKKKSTTYFCAKCKMWHLTTKKQTT